MIKEKDYEAQYTAYFISRIIELIKENYYVDIPYKNLYQAAIKGILSGLDEYSVYLLPEKEHKTSIKEYEVPVEEYKTKDNISVIEIKEINRKAATNLKEIVNRLLYEENVNKIIIDLRNNIGGMTDCLYDICKLLISRKEVFKKKNRKNTEEYVTENLNRTFEKIVVLVNEKTMSSAEIMAAAFQDNGNIIVGKKTFGKGFAQKGYKTFDGGYILLTTEEYLRKDGSKIQNQGIIPNIVIEDENSILETACNIIKGKKSEEEW